ncbi:MAG TPA: hypothetical protein VMV18_15620 [bacterium]|nr:hypothetical protein [bacterium]
MRVVFPADPARAGRVHPDFLEESTAAAAEGVASAIVDLVALSAGDLAGAVTRVRPSAGEKAVWRGAPLDSAQARALAAALEAKGLTLTAETESIPPARDLRAFFRALRTSLG